MRTLPGLMGLLVATALVGGTACNKKKEEMPPSPKGEPSAVPPTSPSTTAAPTAATAPSDATGAAVVGLADCPSAVPGATTVIATDKGAVVLTVTGDTEEVSSPIKNRAHRLADAQKAMASSDASSLCPVILADTEVEVVDLEKGVRIAVKPTPNGLTVEALQREADRRLAALEQARKKEGGAPGPSGTRPGGAGPAGTRPAKPGNGNSM